MNKFRRGKKKWSVVLPPTLTPTNHLSTSWLGHCFCFIPVPAKYQLRHRLNCYNKSTKKCIGLTRLECLLLQFINRQSCAYSVTLPSSTWFPSLGLSQLLQHPPQSSHWEKTGQLRQVFLCSHPIGYKQGTKVARENGKCSL